MYKILTKNLNLIKKSKKKKFFSFGNTVKKKLIPSILLVSEKIKNLYTLEQ